MGLNEDLGDRENVGNASLSVARAREAKENTEQSYDMKGYPIYLGDLLRSFHFVGPRRKMYYLYHTVVLEKGNLYMVPTSHLESSLANGGGKCLLKWYQTDTESEIISGHGPDPYLTWDERPRKKS